jgi:TolB-like protein/DNA-binding winged helix-turn-helix (wHTH) protein/Tfp pilus assembly protein PilF
MPGQRPRLAFMGEPQGFRFGQFDVDTRTGELRKQGMKLRVRGRPVDILLLLLAKPGELVSRDELRARLWAADTFVDFDHGLHAAVNRLRDALGDSADNPRFVETIPRKGYRFIAPVTPVYPESAAERLALQAEPPLDRSSASERLSPEPTPATTATVAVPARSRAVTAMTVTAAALLVSSIGLAAALWWGNSLGDTRAGPFTMAVIPFENLSGDANQEYFSDGFTEEVIAELGMIGPEKLAVIGRTTSMLYKGARKTIGEIGRELNADYLLEGSVRRVESRIRITAQLVDTKSMAQLWTHSFDREVGDVLAVQREVAQDIARSLALTLTPQSAAVSTTPTPSFAAYELYMRGRYFREQATADGARKAIEYFDRALAIDPTYAAAHAAVADAYRLLGAPGWEVEPPGTLLSRAKISAERALALDPSSPQARAVLAMVRMNYDWDLAGAEREIKEALRLNPSFSQAHQYYSAILTCMNRMDEAVASARRAVELDPLAPTATTSLGVRYYYAGRLDEARAEFLKTLELTPGFPVAHWGLAQIHRAKGEYAEQIGQLRSATQLAGNSSYMRAHLAYGFAVWNRRIEAETLRKELEAESATTYVAPYHLALIAVGLGQFDEAMRWLARAVDDRSGWLAYLPVEPEFQPMRQRADFQQLLTRVRR